MLGLFAEAREAGPSKPRLLGAPVVQGPRKVDGEGGVQTSRMVEQPVLGGWAGKPMNGQLLKGVAWGVTPSCTSPTAHERDAPRK